MLSSMSFVKIDGQQRYIEFEKNRNNGKVRRKVYFNKVEGGDIEFNEEVYRATYEQVKDKKSSLNEFIDQLNDASSETSLDEMNEDTGTEMSVEQMEEADQLEFENDVAGRVFSDVEATGRQVDLEDSIAEIEAENSSTSA